MERGREGRKGRGKEGGEGGREERERGRGGGDIRILRCKRVVHRQDWSVELLGPLSQVPVSHKEGTASESEDVLWLPCHGFCWLVDGGGGRGGAKSSRTTSLLIERYQSLTHWMST
jgi:hypothetical protein